MDSFTKPLQLDRPQHRFWHQWVMRTALGRIPSRTCQAIQCWHGVYLLCHTLQVQSSLKSDIDMQTNTKPKHNANNKQQITCCSNGVQNHECQRSGMRINIIHMHTWAPTENLSTARVWQLSVALEPWLHTRAIVRPLVDDLSVIGPQSREKRRTVQRILREAAQTNGEATSLDGRTTHTRKLMLVVYIRAHRHAIHRT